MLLIFYVKRFFSLIIFFKFSFSVTALSLNLIQLSMSIYIVISSIRSIALNLV